MRGRPNVFTIPAGTPFLSTFVSAFRDGRLFGTAPLSPQMLAASRIFVPSRRSATALLSAFAAEGAGLLPRILPLGDADALDEALPAIFSGADRRASTIGVLDRQLALFRLIDGWRAAVVDARQASGEAAPFLVAASRADAFALTSDLVRLIDEAIIDDVPLSRLADGIPADYRPEQHSTYWAMTEAFLRIAARAYPEMLTEAGLIDGADALKLNTRAFADALAAAPPAAPVVIAGSTGSVTATAELMATVARLPMGAVVLPGFDRDVLDTVAWDSIGHPDADLPTRFAHPQVLLKRSVARIGIGRDAVQRLSHSTEPNPREVLLAEVFRPAQTTGHWAEAALSDAALIEATRGMTLVNAADEREEALAIALLFRQTLETPGQTAALVTPDRTLARAVQAELQRWDVEVADSAGEPLALTQHALLARLALAAARPDASGVDLLAVLRHRLTALGLSAEAREAAVDAIEIAGLRGKRLKGGVHGMPHAMGLAFTEPLRHAPAPRKRLTAAAVEQGLAHAERLATAFAGFCRLSSGAAPLRALAASHRTLMEALVAGSDDLPGALSGPDGEALANVFAAVAEAADDGPLLGLGDYTQIFETLLAGHVVRPRQPGHPRLKIWGLLEARLLDADRVILAGLDEGIWPPDLRGDPFLNRPMRIALGLQPPERRIGQTAHDIMILLGAPEVVMTRADKRGSAPTIASRFLRRLLAFAGGAAERRMREAGQPVLDWARALDRPDKTRPIAPPEPRVPARLTPAQLNVTEIETLYRDPYTIFARRVLKLDPLEPIDPPLDARERGIIVHEALSRFTHAYAAAIPEDAAERLLNFGKAAFAEIEQSDPEAMQFWWHRFKGFVPWFLTWEANRRLGIDKLHSEIAGALPIRIAGGHILRLSTRADRIELLADGSIAVIDYKTGAPPGNDEVLRGLAPQLPLTAALIKRGAFEDIGRRDLKQGIELGYLHVARARGDGLERMIEPDKQTMQEVVDTQFDALRAYVRRLMTGQQGYQSHRLPKKTTYRGDYDHLARHLEWSLGGEDETWVTE